MAEKRKHIEDFEHEEIVRRAIAGAGNHDGADSMKGAYLGWDRAKELLERLDKKHFGNRRVEDRQG